MSIIEFEALENDQQTKVQDAYGTREHQCSGCAVYLGKTSAGEHTYFWHYGVSDGYAVLLVADESPYYDYDSGNITVGGREFTTDGVEVLTPPFEYLCHFDIRKWPKIYLEHDFLTCCECNAGSIPPERAAVALGLPIGQAVSWVGHFYLKPWELTEELFNAAVALTILRPNGDRIAVV
jgi:hypothetical protein